MRAKVWSCRNNSGDTPLDHAYENKRKAAVIAALEAASR